MLLERAAKRESVRELFAVASERLRRLISFQAAAWVATDPHTGVPAGQAWLENIRADDHTRVWEFEFLRADINTYRDLVTAEIPAAGLRLATSERPARSARYREILRPNGFEDGLRAVVRADGSLWASIALLRTAGMPAFDAGKIELVASLSEPLADVVREHVRESAPSSAPNDGHRAGLMVFAAGGELMSANEEARELLDELERTEHSLAPGHLCALPLPAAGALVRARAIAEEREHGPARADPVPRRSLDRMSRILLARRGRPARQHGAAHQARRSNRDRPGHDDRIRALGTRAADHRAHRARSQHREHRTPPAPLAPYGA